MKNKDLEKYIKDLKDKRSRLKFELAEVEDELNSISNQSSVKKRSGNPSKLCPICKGEGEYHDFWAGYSPCSNCRGTGYV